MMGMELLAAKEFRNLTDYAIVSLNVDTNNYFPVIRGVITQLTAERMMGGVYVTSTRPARAIMSRLQTEKSRLDDVYFVDCISYAVGGTRGLGKEQVVYVESPTMLESIMLKIIWLLRRIKSEKKFVFFDSINTLAIYNDQKILSEFFHILINKLRTQEVFTTILSVGERAPVEVESMLRLICDDSVDLRRGLARAQAAQQAAARGQAVVQPPRAPPPSPAATPPASPPTTTPTTTPPPRPPPA